MAQIPSSNHQKGFDPVFATQSIGLLDKLYRVTGDHSPVLGHLWSLRSGPPAHPLQSLLPSADFFDRHFSVAFLEVSVVCKEL